ncbi:MAG: DUF1445 domain-containing protein [Deltaproteobacteria bacterium]|nr:DUF1445 domain-containing protein [Deltaproteobacteria bacterium]
MEAMQPNEFREQVRIGAFRDVTTDACRGYAQANLVVVPKPLAFDFLLFCQRNPHPCPVIEVTEPGEYHPRFSAPGADLRTDLPKYRVFKNGEIIAEPCDILQYWNEDSVAFILGCSTNFDYILRKSNVQYRYIGDHTTSLECKPAGIFNGTMVVSTRIFKSSNDAVRAIQITSRNLSAHGPPVHIGNPEDIGIEDLYHPDMFSFNEDIQPKQPSEIMMSWACGVTPQIVAKISKVPFMISHFPGYMFVTDKRSEELSAF